MIKQAFVDALRELEVGDVVPRELYILDYNDGTTPAWTVVSKKRAGNCLVELVLVDSENRDLFDQARVVVLVGETKALRSPAFVGDTPPSMLCDLWQQQRARRS
ncbi:MAG: hypothetical protein D6698_17295 [Gammaproteobacteria bacterium]|nr:MAG: hypothetical protein D6698_17295 [Gammaproteobacteria bacterium]